MAPMAPMAVTAELPILQIRKRQQLQAALGEAHAQGKTVLLDFTATWCGPCKGIKPRIHALAAQYSAQFTVFEVDVDDAEELVSHFQVRSMPTFVFIRSNKVIHVVVGANSDAVTNACELISKATFPELLP